MKRFKNILFVSHGLNDEVASTKLAISLARRNDATLRGLVVCPELPQDMAEYQPRYEGSLHDVLASSIASSKRDLGLNVYEVPVPIAVESCNKPAISIIQHVQTDNNDLVIKEAEPHGEEGGFKAIDMTLLRKCPCPVWLSRPNSKPSSRTKVAVAIDPNKSGPDYDSLTRSLLEVSRSLSDVCDGELHIISCWNFEFENYLRHNSWIKVSDDELDAQVSSARMTHLASLHDVVNESGISGNIVIHHLHGTAEDVIPVHVEKLDIDILVMGTLARSGIPGFLIGNTAENTFQKLHCSLLALKPAGFVSPIQP